MVIKKHFKNIRFPIAETNKKTHPKYPDIALFLLERLLQLLHLLRTTKISIKFQLRQKTEHSREIFLLQNTGKNCQISSNFLYFQHKLKYLVFTERFLIIVFMLYVSFLNGDPPLVQSVEYVFLDTGYWSLQCVSLIHYSLIRYYCCWQRVARWCRILR